VKTARPEKAENTFIPVPFIAIIGNQKRRSLHCFPIIAMKGTSMKVFSAFSGLAVFTVSLLLL
jgi:hypothetical protein